MKTLVYSEPNLEHVRNPRKHLRWSVFRSSRQEVFLGKGVLKTCSKFTGEHPCRSVISIKLLCNFIEIAFRHGCSPVNLLHNFRTSFLKNTSVSAFCEDSERLYLLSQYQLFMFCAFWNKYPEFFYAGLIFTPEVFILSKIVWGSRGPGAVNFDITSFLQLFIKKKKCKASLLPYLF